MRCPYDPMNASRCPKRGTIPVIGSVTKQELLVCGEHVKRYTSNGYVRMPRRRPGPTPLTEVLDHANVLMNKRGRGRTT